MSTLQWQIDEIKSIAANIAADPTLELSSCYVNDWGQYGNFELIAEFKKETFNNTRKNILTTRLNKALDKALSGTKAHRRETFSPEVTRTTRYGEAVVTYDRKSWNIDVDYQRYSPETNSFN